MATITWTGAAGDDNFNNPANWNPKQVPTATDNAVIKPAHAVTIQVSNTVANLTTASDVTLHVGDYSTLQIGNGGTLATFNNGGTLLIDGGHDAGLVIDAAHATLTGGGTIEIVNQVITASAAGDLLANLNNTIAGNGNIGGGTLTLNNGAGGIINANRSGATLDIDTAKATTNAGLLEATNGGNLQIDTSVNNTGTASILANAATVTLDGGLISGGTLAATNGGMFYDNGNATLNGTAAELYLHANLQVTDYSELNLLGTISSTGTISEAYVHGAGILVGPATGGGTVTLTGGGAITLAASLQAGGAKDVLDNVNNTIGGNGTVGNGTALSIINEAAGIFDANNTGLSISIGTATLTNRGLLEATNAGNLYIDSAVSNAATAHINAAGGTVYLQDGSSILGGTLSSSGGADIVINSGSTISVLNGVTNTGTIDIADGSAAILRGTFTNTGTLFESYVHGAGLLLGQQTGQIGTVTLTGAGTITLDSNLQASQSGQTLDNINNTINGSGALGDGTSLAIINAAAGIIDATGGLTLNIGTATLTNTGLLEATGTGGLYLDNIVSNNGGHITAAGADVFLQDGSVIRGGTLASSGGAVIAVNSGNTLTVLDGRTNTLTNTGTVQILDSATAILLGTIANTGLITESYVHGTGLLIGPSTGTVGTATLTGGGTVTLASNLQANQAGDTLVNVNNIIDGTGNLGNDTNLAVINQAGGIIDANVGGAIAINTNSTVLMNAGLIEATGVSGLQLYSAIDNGAAGVVGAYGGNVVLNDGAAIRGGTLSATGTTHFYVSSGSTLAVLDGTAHAITIAATVEVQDYSGLVLQGTIINDGLIFRDYVHGPGIVVAAGTVFTNNGTLQAYQGDLAFGTSTALTNDVSPMNSGTLAVGTLTGGTYQAFGSTLSFASAVVGTLAAGTTVQENYGSVTFEGREVATSVTAILAGASLQLGNITASGSQTLTNSGTLALNAADYGLAALVNAAGGTLTGNGTLAATVKNSGFITANGGELDLAGTSNSLGGTLAAAAGSTIGIGGTASLLSGAVVTASDLALLNNATLQLAAKLSFAGTFDIRGNASLTGAQFATSGLFEQVGNGTATIAASVAATGTIATTQGGTLAFTGSLTTTGATILDNGGFLETGALTAKSLTIGGGGSASIATQAGAGASTLASLTIQGGTLNTNNTTLTVTGDYTNTAAGTGNNYTPFAGVTGTIDANATHLSIVGTKGTTITMSGGHDIITIAAGKTAYFEIRNSGPATASILRGALETIVNGGSITGTALSGTGVTAANFGPLAGSTNSSIYAIKYDGSAPLSGEAIHLASDFANVAGLTIDIVSAPSTPASLPQTHALSTPDTHAATLDWHLALSHLR